MATETSEERFYEDYIFKGVTDIWNNDQQSATEQLQDYKDQFPRDALEFTNIHQNITWMTNSKKDMQITLDQVKHAEAIADDFLKNPAKIDKMIMTLKRKETVTPEERLNYTFDVKLVAAEALLSRGLMQLGLGNFIKGPYNLRKSWKKFEKLFKELEANESQYALDLIDEIKYNVAVFYFLVSFTPGALLKIMELIGFVADREKGMDYLNQVVRNNGIKAPLASLFLCFNYLLLPRGLSNNEENLEAASKVIDTIRSRYPKGTFPSMMSAVYHMKKGELPTATQYFRECIEASKVVTDKPPSMHCINLAFCLIAQREFEEAIQVLQALSAQPDAFDGRCMAALSLASCYKILGRDSEAEAVMNQLPEFLKHKTGRLDGIASKKYENFKKRDYHLGIFEFLYLRRDLHHLKADDLTALLNLIKTHQAECEKNPELKAIYNLVQGVMLRGLGDKQAAAQSFQAVLDDHKRIKSETWTLPNAHYELGEDAYWSGDIESAKSHLKSVSKYKDYEMAEVTSNRANLGLNQIAKDEKKK